jgi:nitrous oxidase accessory protein
LVVDPSDNLQQILDRAEKNSRIELAPGRYTGNFRIAKPGIQLVGQKGVMMDGGGKGDGIRITAADVVVENLTVRNWGDDLTLMNAGIYLEEGATRAVVRNNDLAGPSTGIWLERCEEAKVVGNRIEGDTRYRSSDRGNGIHLSIARNTEVRGNTIRNARDGIYILTSDGNLLAENRIENLRYGIHYMYSQNNRIIGNYAKNVRAAYALMQSHSLTVINNVSEETEDYGFLINYITRSTIVNNRVYRARQPNLASFKGTEGKAIFIYNSLYNRFEGNQFEESDIGVHLTAGSEENAFFGNAFVHNTIQVKYVANRKQDWSQDGKGNYWSNYVGWDMDGDGMGDSPFEPNDAVDLLLWKYPQARQLMYSPAVLLMRYVQQQFPVLKPPGVIDSFPLMENPGFRLLALDQE